MNIRVLEKEFLENKVSFLNDTYSNENTRKAYASLYKNIILEEEIHKGKDLMCFTSEELKEVMLSLVSNKQSSKGSVASIVTKYLDYCINKGYILTNNMKTLSVNELKKENKRFILNDVVNLNKFYKWLTELEIKHDLYITLPLLFARYGIVGEELNDMMNAKYEDIDRNNFTININGVLFPIDKQFINWIDKATQGRKKEGLILFNYKGQPITSKNTIYNMFYKAFQLLNRKRISAKELRNNRKMDLLFHIRSCREVTIHDIENVEYIIGYNNNNNVRSNIIRTKKTYELLSGCVVN